MNLLKSFGFFVIAAILVACKPQTTAEQQKPKLVRVEESDLPTQAQPRLQTMKLFVGPAELTAEIAKTREETQAGLMFRKSVPENEGMLFVFPIAHQSGFWMKNTQVPLSVAYIDPDGIIQEIHPLEPHNTNSVQSARDNIQFALEVNRGWFERNNVQPGAKIATEKGSLQETFFRAGNR